MPIVAVTLKIRPEHREEFVQAASRLAEQTRTEPGFEASEAPGA